MVWGGAWGGTSATRCDSYLASVRQAQTYGSRLSTHVYGTERRLADRKCSCWGCEHDRAQGMEPVGRVSTTASRLRGASVRHSKRNPQRCRMDQLYSLKHG